jgi:midasin
LNQNTDSSDLLGGFKPVDVKFLLKPVYELFLGVFKKLFKSGKNQKFLDLAQTCYEENQVKEFIQCLTHGVTSIKSKKGATPEDKLQTQRLEQMLLDLTKRAQKLESGGGFIFQFIEGTLIKSLQNGDWILLDEINLASDSVLNRLATLIEGDHILLNERADIVETQRHPEFRIFMCMNPPYTSAGKKSLPPSLRAKLTELYVPELETEADLWPIVDRNAPSSMFSERQKRQILEFYLKARAETQGNSKRGNIGLRNLSRSMKMMRQAVTLKYPVVKAIHDALFTCFASHLEAAMQKTLQLLICKLFEIDSLPKLDAIARR